MRRLRLAPPTVSHLFLAGIALLATAAGCGGDTGKDGAVTTGGTDPGTGGQVEAGGAAEAGNAGAGEDGASGALGEGGNGAVATGGTGAVATGGTGAVATGGTGADGTGGAGATGTGGAATLVEQTVPFQEWSGPGASVTGILFAHFSEAYGAALAWSRGPSGGPPPAAYWFSSDGSSPYALYFPSSGEGENYLEDWTVNLASGESATYDAAMFTPETPNPWGLTADAHLVTLEVNDGRGSDGGLHFIATDVTVLDGTAAVPMDVVEVMASAAQDFDARVASLDAELDAELALARDATAPPADAEFTPTESQGVWPTWYPESSTLALTFVHQRLENWGEMTGVIETPGMPPPYPEIWDYHYYGAEYVVRTVIDASGTTLDTTEYGPAGFGE